MRKKILVLRKVGFIVLLAPLFFSRAEGKEKGANYPERAFAYFDVVKKVNADIPVKGKVISDIGEALPGVSVSIKGTTNGTITDAEGNYTISVPDEKAVLIFSFVGYAVEEMPVNNQTTINISLLPTIETLSELVVVGYGTQIKKDLTGAITSIKAADIRDMAVTSPDALLQGKAAGVQVIQNSGTPGGEIFIRVRGTSSLRADSRPLYVIDGVPMNNLDGAILESAGQRKSALADINPNDIESMEILKDASATAIYGARGSNGVILITTKRGKEGKARFSFDSYYGTQQVAKKLDLLNGQEYSDLLKEEIANRNGLLTPANQININNSTYQEVLKVNELNTNYQDEIFRTAPISSYNLSVAGGNDKLASFTSLGIFSQKGTIIGQDFDRINGRVNLDYQATSKLKIGNSFNYTHSKTARITNDYSGASILANALLRNPNLPVRNSDNTYSVDPLGRNGTENPILLANEINFNSTQGRLIANVYGEFEIIEGLKFKSLFGMDNLQDRVERFSPSFVLANSGSASAQAANLNISTWNFDNTLNYSKAMNENHRVTALAGVGLQKSTNSFLQAGGNTAGSDIITTIAVSVSDIPTHTISTWSLLSYFGRATYSFKDKYILEGSFRADGSSRFGKNKKFGYFPAISGAWRIIEESFMKGVPLLSDMKVRIGYGLTGNQEGLENFGSLTRYGTGRNYDGLPGISQANVPNPDLGWESTKTTNFGLDLAFLKSRVNVSVDGYIKKTKDLLFTRQLPWTSGFSEISNVNLGDMENKGIEVTVFTRNLDGDLKWTTNFNISYNVNKITSLPQNGSAGSDLIFQLPSAFNVEGPYSIYRVGESVGSFYGYRFQGVYASDEDVPDNLKDAGIQNFKGGYPMFADRDGNGVYERQFDREIIGNALPLHTGGITNTFSYKGLELNVFMNWSYGNDIYNVTRAVMTSMADEFNQTSEVRNRWKQSGDKTDVPVAMYTAGSFQGVAFTDASSRYIEDGSFLRVRNVTLAYNLPSSVISKAGLSSARVYLSGQNLHTFTKYSGYDPESQNTGGNLIPTLGADYLTQPQPRVYMIGINLGF